MKSYTLTKEEAARYDDPDERVWRDLTSSRPTDRDIYHPGGFMIRAASDDSYVPANDEDS
jgi:hypothetical protein